MIIEWWKLGRLTLCLTGAILDEYIDVLMRLGLSGTKDLDDLLLLFRKGFNAVFIAQTPSLSVCDDPDDNKFIEAAVALEAEWIVSGDLHLKKIKRYGGIAIRSPKEFIERSQSV